MYLFDNKFLKMSTKAMNDDYEKKKDVQGTFTLITFLAYKLGFTFKTGSFHTVTVTVLTVLWTL